LYSFQGKQPLTFFKVLKGKYHEIDNISLAYRVL